MGELSDAWMSEKRVNRWAPSPPWPRCRAKEELAGALHGALQAGALATSFTASQGLLLMIPNMYKIAGELLPCRRDPSRGVRRGRQEDVPGRLEGAEAVSADRSAA